MSKTSLYIYVVKMMLARGPPQMFPERFIPRYSMVMFHRYPYAEVLQRGQIQDAILNELCHEIDAVKDLDEARATYLVQQRLALINQPA